MPRIVHSRKCPNQPRTRSTRSDTRKLRFSREREKHARTPICVECQPPRFARCMCAIPEATPMNELRGVCSRLGSMLPLIFLLLCFRILFRTFLHFFVHFKASSELLCSLSSLNFAQGYLSRSIARAPSSSNWIGPHIDFGGTLSSVCHFEFATGTKNRSTVQCQMHGMCPKITAHHSTA